MYESHFRFSSRPFSSAPAVDTFFPAESIEAARQTLVRTIDRAEGVGLAVGPAGVGKTLLCRLLAARFQNSFNVAMLSSARVVTRKSLLQNILFELGLEYRGLEEGELRLSLLDYLQPNDHCPNGMLLIVDEAHNLGLRLLEEVRMITNLVRDGLPRVRLLLAGGQKLEERFTSPKLESFNQRITARCYLHGFSRDETAEYVRTRIVAAGAAPDSVFTPDALVATHQATDGIPRLVNQVCDHALVMAFAGGRHTIDAGGIEEAWADLQQLPGPWQTEAAASGSAVVEFGSLDGDDAQLAGDGAELSVEGVAGAGAYEFPTMPAEEQADGDTVVISGALDVLPPVEPTTESEADAPVRAETPAAVEVNELTRDPFGEAFEEEVVVVDRTTVRESIIFAGRPRVQSAEGQALSVALRNADAIYEDGRAPEISVESAVHEPAESTVEPAAEAGCDAKLAGDAEPEPAAEPQSDGSTEQPAAVSEMFEYTVFEPNSSADLALQTLCEVNIAMGELEQPGDAATDSPIVKLAEHRQAVVDDRGIIDVEAESDGAEPPADAGKSPHQVEYQELFAQLRHG